MSSIVNRINEAGADFEIKTGLKPRHVYLGKFEWSELSDWAAANGYYEKTPSSDDLTRQRPEVEGMLCFLVDIEFHLVCC